MLRHVTARIADRQGGNLRQRGTLMSGKRLAGLDRGIIAGTLARRAMRRPHDEQWSRGTAADQQLSGSDGNADPH